MFKLLLQVINFLNKLEFLMSVFLVLFQCLCYLISGNRWALGFLLIYLLLAMIRISFLYVEMDLLSHIGRLITRKSLLTWVIGLIILILTLGLFANTLGTICEMFFTDMRSLGPFRLRLASLLLSMIFPLFYLPWLKHFVDGAVRSNIEYVQLPDLQLRGMFL
nr:hypothetical protein [Linepithema humile polycipivirus 1]